MTATGTIWGCCVVGLTVMLLSSSPCISQNLDPAAQQPLRSVVETEQELSYKIWEMEQYSLSFADYVARLESVDAATTERAVDGSHDAHLQAAMAALATNPDDDSGARPLALTLSQAMQLCISSNKDVQLALINPALAENAVVITGTVYDPVLFSDYNYYDTDRPIQSLLDTGKDGKDSLSEQGWLSQTGIRQPLPTGGDAKLVYEADHLETNSELTIPNPQYTSRLRVELRQSLLKELGDASNKSDRELARLALDQAQGEYKTSLSDIVRELTSYYWRYKYYYELAEISRKAVAGAAQVMERIEIRQEQGLGNLLDMDRARTSYQDRLVRLATDEKLVMVTLDQLKQVLGISPISGLFFRAITPTESFAKSFTLGDRSSTLQGALSRRNEIGIARKAVDAAELKMKLASHLRLPTVDARTSYTFNGLGAEYDDSVDSSFSRGQGSWNAGIWLEWPIGGRQSSLEEKKAMLAVRKAQLEYKKRVEQIAYEVNTYYSELEMSQKEVAAAKNAVVAYELVLEREQGLFELSRLDNQRILDSQDEYHEAQRAHLQALLNLHLSFMRLQWAKGVLLEFFAIEG